MLRRRVIPVLALMAAACGGDPTAPVSLAGEWGYVSLDLENALARDCSIEAGPITFTQTGSTFTGSIGTADFVCGSSTFLGTQPIVDGTITGNYVSFKVYAQAPHWENSGVLRGDTIFGTTLFVRPNQATPTFSGHFRLWRMD